MRTSSIATEKISYRDSNASAPIKHFSYGIRPRWYPKNSHCLTQPDAIVTARLIAVFFMLTTSELSLTETLELFTMETKPSRDEASPLNLDKELSMKADYLYDASKRQPAYAGATITNANLVLEGGAMRGQFTAGVLDFFMDQGLWCKHVIGTSAGALNGYNYVAGELGRTCFLNTKYCDDPRYLSMKNFVRTGNALGDKFVFHDIPETLEPFNFEAFRESPMELTTVASDLETGEADYHVMETADEFRDIEYLRASASMPLVSRIVEIDGKKLLDGGPTDSVALLHSLLMGTSDKHIVVLTQDASYVKAPNKTMPLIKRFYSDYPYFVERVENRHYEYNRCYRWMKRLHDEGRIFVLQPSEPVTVSSMEHDANKLFELYEQGLQVAAQNWDALQKYLGQ